MGAYLRLGKKVGSSMGNGLGEGEGKTLQKAFSGPGKKSYFLIPKLKSN